MNDHKESEKKMSIIELGQYEGIPILVRASLRWDVDLHDLSSHIKQEVKELKKSNKLTLRDFEDGLNSKKYEISTDEYKKLIALQDSIIKHRSIDNDKYLSYLLQSCTIPELKATCKDYSLKGYSNFRKQELIEFITLNLSREEQQEFLLENEKAIILKELKSALEIIYNKGIEKIIERKVTNRENKELELTCEKRIGENTWKNTAYLSMSNIDDPERDCDSTTGAFGGFCPHFWMLFIKACAESLIDVGVWKLSYFPDISALTRLRDKVLQET
jgi:hypothetical protein